MLSDLFTKYHTPEVISSTARKAIDDNIMS